MQKKPVSFLEALFGLLLTPGSVAEGLFDQDDPPYVFTILLLFVVSIFLPLWLEVIALQLISFRLQFVTACLIAVFSALLCFVTIETIFLRLVGVKASLNRTFSVITYSLVPLLIALWLFYGLNYFYERHLTIFTILLTDSGSLPYELKKFIPYLIGIAQIGMLVTFFSCLKQVGELYLSTAFMVALLSALPLWFSLLVGILVAELVFPGAIMAVAGGIPGIEMVQRAYNAIGPHKLSK